MSRLTLNQFKTETKSTNEKETRLTLEQFKNASSNEENEELVKLTGGILGACHCANSSSNDAGIRLMDAVYHWLTD